MIKRKPLYYVVVFIIPSFLIVAVSIAGLFIPSTAGKERQEKVKQGTRCWQGKCYRILVEANEKNKVQQI